MVLLANKCAWCLLRRGFEWLSLEIHTAASHPLVGVAVKWLRGSKGLQFSELREGGKTLEGVKESAA